MVNRGTVINIENITGDIQTALEHIPLQCKSARSLITTVSENLIKIYKDRESLLPFLRLVHTGHSLGGILADCNAIIGVHSITFENPGSKRIARNNVWPIRFITYNNCHPIFSAAAIVLIVSKASSIKLFTVAFSSSDVEN